MPPRTRSPSSPRSTSARGQGPGGGASSVCAGVALGGAGAGSCAGVALGAPGDGSGAGGAPGGAAAGAVSAASTHPFASHATVDSLAAIPVNSLDGGPTLRRVPAAGSITTGRSAPRRAGASAATRSPANRGAVRPATPLLPGSCPTGTPGAPVISLPSIAATTRAPSVMSRWRSSMSPECRPTSIELLELPRAPVDDPDDGPVDVGELLARHRGGHPEPALRHRRRRAVRRSNGEAEAEAGLPELVDQQAIAVHVHVDRGPDPLAAPRAAPAAPGRAAPPAARRRPASRGSCRSGRGTRPAAR